MGLPKGRIIQQAYVILLNLDKKIKRYWSAMTGENGEKS